MRPKTLKQADKTIETITDAIIYEQTTTQDQTTINVLREELALAQENKAILRRNMNKRNRRRLEVDDALRSFGLVKVRGAVTGKTYWE